MTAQPGLSCSCDFCGRERPFFGRVWRWMMPTLFYCAECAPAAKVKIVANNVSGTWR